MSKKEGAAAPLRAVPEGSAEPVPSNGLTPPHKKKAGSRFISDVIVEMGFLARERVEAAVEEGKASGRSPEQVLLEGGAITGDQLARAVAQRFGLDHVDLTLYKMDVSALNSITPQAARRLNAVPVGRDDAGILMIAMSDPSNVLALDDLKLMTGSEVRPVVASPDDIQGLIGRMSRFDDAVAAAIDLGEEELAEGREIRVRFRVDGVLRETTQIPRRMVAGVVSRVKIMADLDIAEKRVPQDGRVSLTVEKHAIDTRVVTMPRVDGEGIVMRILDKSQALIGLDSLGMGE